MEIPKHYIFLPLYKSCSDPDDMPGLDLSFITSVFTSETLKVSWHENHSSQRTSEFVMCLRITRGAYWKCKFLGLLPRKCPKIRVLSKHPSDLRASGGENTLGKISQGSELTKNKGTEMAFSLEHKPAIMCMFINDT